MTWISAEGAERQTSTGADGIFEAPDPAIAAAQLIVHHPDYAPKRSFASGGDRTRGLDQKLEAGVALRGLATDHATQRPVSDAEIWVDDTWLLSRTDASGAFSIKHAPADWTTVTARTRQTIGSAKRKAEALVIALSPSRSLSGTVMDAVTHKPLEGATVSVSNASGTTLSAGTDAQGHYLLTGLPAGRYEPYVGRPGYSSPSRQPRTIDLRTALSDRFDLELARLPQIEGRVVDEQNQPVEGALVALGFSDTPHVYSSMWVNRGGRPTRTAQDGAFTLTLPEVEEAGVAMPSMMKDRPLVVLKQGFAAARVKLSPSSTKPAPILVTLTRGVELRGRITTPQGAPGTLARRRRHCDRGGRP